MFLINIVTKFDLGLVPDVFKKGWESEHGGGHLTLDDLQSFARFWVKAWGLFVAGCTMVSVSVSILLYVDMTRNQNFQGGWLSVVLPIALLLFVWAVSYWFRPVRVTLFEQFVDEYNEVIGLLCHDWGQEPWRYEDGPGLRLTFAEMEPFIRKKLESMAAQIKELEKLPRYRLFKSDLTNLKKRFDRAFDILKPFGFVYPTYDPYFNPGGLYFYG